MVSPSNLGIRRTSNEGIMISLYSNCGHIITIETVKVLTDSESEDQRMQENTSYEKSFEGAEED